MLSLFKPTQANISKGLLEELWKTSVDPLWCSIIPKYLPEILQRNRSTIYKSEVLSEDLEKQKRRIVGGTADSEEWSEVLSIGGMVGRSVKTKLAKRGVLFKDLFIGGTA